jgi:hypothetical protein
LPEDSVVTLTLLDPAGQEIARVIDAKSLPAGTHNVDFLAKGYNQGLYFYRLHIVTQAKTFTDTKRIFIGG